MYYSKLYIMVQEAHVTFFSKLAWAIADGNMVQVVTQKSFPALVGFRLKQYVKSE